MIKVGQTYKTYGDWEAIVIWKSAWLEGQEPSYIVIHKPQTAEETMAYCDEDGVAQSMFALNEPPTYESHHPADLRWDISKESE
jgi:hypothetical protein